MTELVPIKNFDGYFITRDGKVYSKKRNFSSGIRELKQDLSDHGYYRVVLRKNGKPKHMSVHRLVAETFLLKHATDTEVNHKNGIRTDNRVCNLEWCTRSQNIKHAFDVLGRKGPKTWLGKRGASHSKAKPVLQIRDNVVINEFGSGVDAEEQTGISRVNISSCCLGKQRTAGGFEWKFK